MTKMKRRPSSYNQYSSHPLDVKRNIMFNLRERKCYKLNASPRNLIHKFRQNKNKKERNYNIKIKIAINNRIKDLSQP